MHRFGFRNTVIAKKPRQICTPVVLDGTATREVYVCRASTARMPRKRCQKKRRPLVVVSERAPYSVHFGVRQRQSAWTCYILVEGFLRYRYNHTLKKQPPIGNRRETYHYILDSTVPFDMSHQHASEFSRLNSFGH